MNDVDFLKAVIEFVECAEWEAEAASGSPRSIEELIAEDLMPPLYAEAKKRLEEVLRA